MAYQWEQEPRQSRPPQLQVEHAKTSGRYRWPVKYSSASTTRITPAGDQPA
jgi:hypothetical protein